MDENSCLREMDEKDLQEEDEDEEELKLQEAAYQKQYENEQTWDQLQEDEHGLLRVDRVAEQRAKRLRLQSAVRSARIRKGMIRYLILAIDMSRAASAQDFRPSRLGCMLTICKTFIREFFDQNPLSQLGIIIMRGGLAEKLTDLSASPDSQIKRLTAYAQGADGDASLQNALELGNSMLKSVPPYGHRELLVMFAALSTCDPGNIYDSVKASKEAKIRVSVVGVAAEVYVCKRSASDTGGTYGVAMSEAHLEELMMAHAPPPPTSSAHAGSELVRMGFPQRSAESDATAVYVGPDPRLLPGGFTCPQCKTRVAELPCQCHVCNLQLISSPHLARSYHHLFPVTSFVEVPRKNLDPVDLRAVDAQGDPDHLACYGCLKDLMGTDPAQPPLLLKCPLCKQLFCFECDLYIHECLHNCPGCECAGNAGASIVDG